jgi:hypothetical protein
MPEQFEQTSLSKVADNLVSSLFDGGVSSNEVLTPEEPVITPEKEAAVFTPESNVINAPNMEFTTSELIGDVIGKSQKPAKTALEVEQESERLIEVEDEEEDETPFKFLGDLYKDNVLVPFEGEDQIKTVKDLKELVKANVEEAKRLGKEEGTREEFESLPEPVKVLIEYAKSGGTDFGTLFSLLSRTEQVQEYNIDTEEGQVGVVKQYYEDLGWDDDEIETQVNILKDAGPERLRMASEKFKEKVDTLNESRLQHELAEQKKLDAQAQAMKQTYIQNLTSTLKKGTLGGLTLTREEQKDIYSALVEERYSSIGGGSTNRLGALLNKIQFQEPNFELLAEVHMLLNNREEYHKKIKDSITTAVTGEQVRKIKSEQGLKGSGSEIQQAKRTGLRRLGNISNPFK